jgi:Flp pilus assembly protein TadD
VLASALALAACGGARTAPAAQMLSDQGAHQLEAGRLEEAEASLRLALEVDPGSAPAHANLGLVRLARGDLEGAEASLRGAIRAREDFVEAWADLGVVLERRGRGLEARAAYEHALSIDPTLPMPRLVLARLLVRCGLPVEARAHLLRLVALLPDDAEALGLLAWAELRVDRPSAASELVDRALAIDPDAAAARFTLALLRARRGELGPARDVLLELEGDPVLGHEARLRIATIDVLAGAHLLAHARLDPLLEDDPFDPALQLVAAVLARDEGRDEDAITHAREARTLEPALEEAWLLEAEACTRTGDLACASEALAHVRASTDSLARERERVAGMRGR